jgi:heat shock protein HtpX
MAATYRPPTTLVLAGQARRNQRAYRQIVAAVVIALALLGLVVGLVAGAPGLGLGLGLAAAVLLTGLAPGLGERVALARTGAAPADPERHPRYHNLVEGLCRSAGAPVPRLLVVDADAANAFAVGRTPGASSVVVTRGLLAGLNRVELEGVLAHELAHVRSGATRLNTLAVVLGGAPGLLWEARRRGGGAPLGAAAAVLAPLALLLRLAAPPGRELDADLVGAYLTRYPPGLISALGKLEASLQADPGRLGGAGLEHLWIVAPGPAPRPGPPLERLTHTHPPVEARIAALREL